MSLLLPLLLSGPAAATTWWVADGAERARVEQALADLWPEHGLEVSVGPPGDQDDLWHGDGQLSLVRGERRWTAPVGADPWLQVAVARSWLREVRTEAPAPAPVVVPPPAPMEPRAPLPRGPWLAATVGAGERLGGDAVELRGDAAGGLASGGLRLGLAVGAAQAWGERWGERSLTGVGRLRGAAHVAIGTTLGPSFLSLGLEGGALALFPAATSGGVGGPEALPTGALLLRGEPAGTESRPVVGLRVEGHLDPIDGIAPWAVHAEVGLALGGPR